MIAPSSIMHPEPMMIGPPAANIVAFGCTMVPAPMVMSPFMSTSWHTTAFEWMVNLSLLTRTVSDSAYVKVRKKHTLEASTGESTRHLQPWVRWLSVLGSEHASVVRS